MVEGANLHLIRNVSRVHGFNPSSPSYWSQINANIKHVKQWFYGISEGHIGVNNAGMRDGLVFHLPYHIIHGPHLSE